MNTPHWRTTLAGMVLVFTLAACASNAQSTTATITASPLPSASSTPLPTTAQSTTSTRPPLQAGTTLLPTMTPPPSLTPTPSNTPTPTITPTPAPTATPTPLLLALIGTPLPLPLAPIQVSNVAQVSGLAEWQQAGVTDLAWTPDGQSLAVSSVEGINLYDIQTRQNLRALYPKGAPGVVSIAFSSTGSWLISGSRLGSEQEGFGSNLQLWQGPGWRPLGILYSVEGGLSQVAFSPDGDVFVAAFASPVYQNNVVDFWDTTTWEITQTLQTGPVLNVAFSPGGKILATTPDRYAIKIWDLKKAGLTHTLYTSFTGAVSSFAFSPDGSRLASGHYDGTIRLWDVASGDLVLATGSQELGVVESLAFSPDGRLLASGHGFADNLVRIWDAGTGDLLRGLPGHQHAADHLIFSPDGQVLVSSSYDGTLRLWGIRR